MRILIKYIIKQSLGSFFIGLGGFILFVSLELLYQLSDLIVRYKVGIDKLFILIYFNLPYFIVLGIPVGVLLSIFWTLSRMRSDNELIALQTHGVTLKSIVIPFLIFSMMLCLVAYSFNDFIVPISNRKASEAIAKYVYKRPEVTLKENAFLEDGRGRYLYIKRIDPETGELQNLLLYDLSSGKTRVISAESASKESGRWIMHDGRVYETDSKGFLLFDMKFDSLELEFEQDINQYIRSSKSPREMTSSELRKKIDSFNKLGVDTSSLQVALQEKLSNSLAPFVIVLLGVPVSLFLNLKSRSWSVILTFVLVVIYQGSGAWLSAMGKENLFNPVLAPWIPNILFTVFGMVIFSLIDTRASYRLSEFLGRVFKISVIVLLISISTTLYAGNLKLSAGVVKGKANEVLLTNGVQLSYNSTKTNITVTASSASILLRGETPVSIAFWGNVRLSTGESEIFSDRAIVELDLGMVQALKAYTKTAIKIPGTGSSEAKSVSFYISGNYVEATAETTPTVAFRDSSFTTCDLKHPHYSFDVSFARLKPGEYLEVENLVMRILDFSVFYFPWYYFRLDDPERRPFQIDLSSIGEGKTTITLRYLKLNWLTLSFSWERNWRSSADFFNFKSNISTNLGSFTGLFQYSEDVLKGGYDLGAYILLKPKVDGTLNFGALYLEGSPSDALKDPFAQLVLGYKTVNKKQKTVTPFELQNEAKLYLGIFNYSSPSSGKVKSSFLGNYALYTETDESTQLWGINANLELPVNFQYTGRTFEASSKSSNISLELGRYSIEDELKYYLNSSAAMSMTELGFQDATFDLKELVFTISSSATAEGNVATSLLLPENMDEFQLDLSDYNFEWGYLSSSGDLFSTFNENSVEISTPISKNGIGTNRVTIESKDRKFILTGNYALRFDSTQENIAEKLFWIDPVKLEYSGLFDVKSDMSYSTFYDGSWHFKNKTTLSREIPFLNQKLGSLKYVMNLSPSYSLDFEATDTKTLIDSIFSGMPALSLENELNYSPSASFSAYVQYNPTINLKSGELKNPGKLGAELKSRMLNAEFETGVNFEALYSPDASFFETGELKTDGSISFGKLNIEHNEKTLFNSLIATETSFDFSAQYGAVSHETNTSYFWNERKLGTVKNTERINLEENDRKVDFTFEWQLSPESTKAEDNPFSIGLGLELTKSLEIGFNMEYPFIYKGKIWPDRISILFDKFKTKYFDIRGAKFDFLTADATFTSSYPFPDRYFTEKFGTGEGRFYILSVDSFTLNKLRIENFFLAAKKASLNGSWTIAAGANRLYLSDKRLVYGTGRVFQNYGLSAELKLDDDNSSFQLNINDLSLGNSLLRRLSLHIGAESFLEIGTGYNEIDWDTLYGKSRPLYLDLHCMAVEGILRINFSGTSFFDIVEMIGIKYYIKALSDRYLVLGLDNGNPYFKFKF
ncbi:hypothetical protein AT15_04580 [Kosmotoga arenicorallina S304]|uniref:Permease n=1 Tax=Kosmotoga arenicorallina S304 TaxID=1453497 RepID=A0A176JXN3_9BACT|nr:LptF/LptG family permease [Kosmotoga arenicorallina]OAA28482.1 hypothetical protein AT15_04580 [Kosmotoga arenicorallina S304]